MKVELARMKTIFESLSCHDVSEGRNDYNENNHGISFNQSCHDMKVTLNSEWPTYSCVPQKCMQCHGEDTVSAHSLWGSVIVLLCFL